MLDPLTALILAFVAISALVCYAIIHNRNVDRKDEEHISVELLRQARIMFPTSDNDIVAVDALYDHRFRECLQASKERREPEATQLRRECILLFNLKNKLITESVRFEMRYMVPPAPPAAGIQQHEILRG